MKTFTVIFAFFLALPAGFAREQTTQLARVTVYWASGGKGSDRYTRRHKTATGVRLCSGHCAVDPRHIPYGSKVVLGDGTSLAAVDTGTAVKTRRAARRAGRTAVEKNALVVDRFFETKGQALSWARTHPMFMPVKVVPPNARPTLLAPLRTVQAQPRQPAYAVVNRNQVQPSLARKFAGSSAVVSAPKPKAAAPAEQKYPLLASNNGTAKPPMSPPVRQDQRQ